METTMRKAVTIRPIEPGDVPAAARLWTARLEQFAGDTPDLIAAWSGGELVESFIASHARSTSGVVAIRDDSLIGYLFYDRFPFHGEDGAFMPIVGHARATGVHASLYELMYREVARSLVASGCISHFLTCFTADTELRQVVFELGFGLYVVDAFRSAELPVDVRPAETRATIRQATANDAAALYELLVEFDGHYRASPLFLVREMESVDDVADCITIENGAVFVAEVDGSIVGFANVVIADESSPITLVPEGAGAIEPLGAYVRPAFRGQGIAGMLLEAARVWCVGRGGTLMHVDFESANLEARAFWPREFRPVLDSVHRRLNQDARRAESATG